MYLLTYGSEAQVVASTPAGKQEALLAVDLYNRPGEDRRLEAFVVQRCITPRTKYGRDTRVPNWSLFGNAWR